MHTTYNTPERHRYLGKPSPVIQDWVPCVLPWTFLTICWEKNENCPDEIIWTLYKGRLRKREILSNLGSNRNLLKDREKQGCGWDFKGTFKDDFWRDWDEYIGWFAISYYLHISSTQGPLDASLTFPVIVLTAAWVPEQAEPSGI